MSKTVYQKILAVSAELVGRLEPDKYHAQGYGYISADKILKEVGQAMVNHGLVLLSEIIGNEVVTVEYVDQWGKSKVRYDAVVEFSMVFVDIEGNETKPAKWSGRGSDFTAPDKAHYKATTSGHKYFMMKQFNIGVGNEDGEHEEGDAAVAIVRKQQQQQQQQQQQKPVQNRPQKQPPKAGEWSDRFLNYCADNVQMDKQEILTTLKGKFSHGPTNDEEAKEQLAWLKDSKGEEGEEGSTE